MRVGIVGCGVIGCRRARVVSRSPGDEVVIVADLDFSRAQALGGELGCTATRDWEQAVARAEVEAMIVSTTNQWLAPVTIAALRNGQHVLCEKPLGRELRESRRMVEAASEKNG